MFKKKLVISLFVSVFLLIPVVAFSTGQQAIPYKTPDQGGNIFVIEWYGITDSSGDWNGHGVSNTLENGTAVTGVTAEVKGYLLGIDFIPFFESGDSTMVTDYDVDSGNSDMTNGWDVVITDTHGRDRAYGLGANLSSTRTDTDTNERVPLSVDGTYIRFTGQKMAPVVSNGGSGNAFIIRMKCVR